MIKSSDWLRLLARVIGSGYWSSGGLCKSLQYEEAPTELIGWGNNFYKQVAPTEQGSKTNKKNVSQNCRTPQGRTPDKAEFLPYLLYNSQVSAEAPARDSEAIVMANARVLSGRLCDESGVRW